MAPMTPAIIDAITEKFGGQSALADAIGADQSTVAHWKRRGIIPARQQQLILEKAREKGIDLMPADFFPPPTDVERPCDTEQDSAA